MKGKKCATTSRLKPITHSALLIAACGAPNAEYRFILYYSQNLERFW